MEKKSLRTLIDIFCVLVGLVVSILMFMGPNTTIAIEIIANYPHADQEIQTYEDLQDLFSLRKKTWGDGTPITLFVFPQSSYTHIALCKQKLKIFPFQLKNIWSDLFSVGVAKKPVLVKSEGEMIRAVLKIPGALGYLEALEKKTNLTVIKISYE